MNLRTLKGKMSFLFGKGESDSTVNTIIDAINDSKEKKEVKYTTTIEFPDNKINGYHKIFINDFFRDVMANVRPVYLKIVIKNYNPDVIDKVNCYYLHTPVPDEWLDYKKLSSFVNHYEFKKDEKIENSSPYLTYCQTDEHRDVLDIDVSQISNVNLVPYHEQLVSLGALVFQLNRKNAGKVTLEITCTLSHFLNLY